jgi:hypothetical protein
MVSFGRSALSDEVFFFATIVTLSFFFWSWALFLRFFLEVSLFFAECRISFPVYFVGVFPRLFLEVGVLVVSLVLLRPFFEIVVEACGCRD